jgi:hypothetical protein
LKEGFLERFPNPLADNSFGLLMKKQSNKMFGKRLAVACVQNEISKKADARKKPLSIKPLSIYLYIVFIYFTLLSVLPIKKNTSPFSVLINYVATDMRIALRV